MEDTRLTQHNPHLVRFYSFYRLTVFVLALIAGLAVASQVLTGGEAMATATPVLRRSVAMLGGNEVTLALAVGLALLAALAAGLLNRGAVHGQKALLSGVAVGTWVATAALLIRNVVAGDFNVLALALTPSATRGEKPAILALEYTLTYGITLIALALSGLAFAFFLDIKGEPSTGVSVAPGVKIRAPKAEDLPMLKALYVGSLVKAGRARDLAHAEELWSSLALRKKLKNTRMLLGHEAPLGFYVAHQGRKNLEFFMVGAGHRRRGMGAFLYRDFVGQASGKLMGWTYTPVEASDRNFFLAKGWSRSGSGDETLIHD